MSDDRKTKPAAGEATVVSGVVGARVGLPRRVGAVVLESQIGEGGMGVVWRGRHEILGREVAVKFLTEAVEEGDPGFGAFVEGARAAAAVRHAGLVEVFDAGVVAVREGGRADDGGGARGAETSSEKRGVGEQSVPYLVMELVDGPGLDQVLRACGALSLGAALAVMEQVCAAIGELHGAGFVHRDIKPGNILLDAEGRARVTDFGLACERPLVWRGTAAEVQSAGRGTISGTPAYMAPEMFAGDVSARSDVYALAVMMFEMVTGGPPFEGDVLALKRAHETEAVPRGRLVERGVPEAVIEVIERGLVKSAMLRPRSAGHWLEALRSAVRDREEWERGRRELKGLASRGRGVDVRVEGAGGSTGYYETISGRAEDKRRAADVLEAEEPVADGATAPTAACVKCGYALGGLRLGGRCPECGTRISESAREGPIPCVWCGYDLVGIDVGGKCPECGRAARESVWPSRLIFADAEWLRRVGVGLRLMAWGLGLLPMLMVVIGLVAVLAAGSSVTGAIGSAVGLSVGFGAVTAVVLFIIGVLNATVPEPGRRDVLVRWMRWVLLGATGLIGASIAAEWAEPRFPQGALLLPGMHMMLAGVVLFGAVVERWGERIPDRKLIRAGRSVFWPWTGAVVVWFAISLVTSWFRGNGPGGPSMQVLTSAGTLGIIFSAVLAAQASKRFRAIAATAKRAVVEARVEEGRAGRGRICWGAAALAVLVFAAAVVPMFLTGPYFHLSTYIIAERLGMLEAPTNAGPGFTFAVDGRTFRGHPPSLISVPIMSAMVIVMYGVPVLLGLLVYLWKGLSGPRGDGRTRCGWCGFELAGLREARCPECGVGIGERPAEGASSMAWTPWKRCRALWVRGAGAAAVFPVMMGVAFVAVIVPLKLPEPGPSLTGVGVIVLTHVPAFVVSLAVFHALARGLGSVRGVTWCGTCGAAMSGGRCGCGASVLAASATGIPS